MRMRKIFRFISETDRDLQSLIAGLNTSPKSSQLMQTINKYKNGCNEVYTNVLESYDMCYKFAQNIVRTIDIFNALSTRLSDLEEYNYRLCEIMSIFIVCELRLSVDASQQEQLLIGHRIIYIMRKYLVREDENETLYNILRTLVYIPKLFNAREIMCAIFGEFIPIKPIPEVNVLPDKLYILYIIVFYRWMMMQKDDDDKLLIVNFAESFMKPSVSLCSNNVYGAYLPMYTTHSTATRTILNNLKFYRDIRNASIINNALRKAGAIVNLCDDENEHIILVDTSPTTDFVEIFASVRLEPIAASMSNIKLERTTVVDTVDLTEEDENTNTVDSISVRHDKWLNEFKKLAEHYRESKLLLEKQMVSDGRKETVICLDSDSEVGAEEISAAVSKELLVAATVKQQNNSEELFVDNYPITNTPLNYDSDLDPSHVADENDVTKISLRFLSDNLRTYQVQKRKMVEKENKRNSDGVGEQNKSEDVDKVYRRDSIHISSTPPDEPQEEDDGTDVQGETDDLLNDEEDVHGYSFLPTTSKSAEKQILLKQLPQYYSSDSAKINTRKKQKKKVTFKTNHLGPSKSNYLGTNVSLKIPLNPAIHLTKYKVSDAPEYYYLRGFERFSCPNSTEDSVSTTSSTKKQEQTNKKCNNKNNYDHTSKSHMKLSVSKRQSSDINIRNVRINLKRIKSYQNVSLTHSKNKPTTKEEPLTLVENNSNSDYNNSFCTKITKSCQLRINSVTSTTTNQKDDDNIFKKPSPVTTKLPKSVKPLKELKVTSPTSQNPYNINCRSSIQMEALDVNSISRTSTEDCIGEKKSLNKKKVTIIKKNIKSRIFAMNDTEVDDLSRKNKFLTDRINSLSREILEKKQSPESNSVHLNKESQKGKKLPIYIKSDELLKNQFKIRENAKEKNNKPIKYPVHEISLSAESDSLASSSPVSTLSKKVKITSNNLENFEQLKHKYRKRFVLPKDRFASSKLSDFEENLLHSKKEITNKAVERNGKGNIIFANVNKEKPKSKSPKNDKISYPTEKDLKDVRTTCKEKNEGDVSSAEYIKSTSKRVKNISAEYLTNESATKGDERVGERNISVPIPSTILPTEEFQADKLLENFNSETKDIVGSKTFSTKTFVSEGTYSSSSSGSRGVVQDKHISPTAFVSSIQKASATLKRSCEKVATNAEKKLISKFQKKRKTVVVGHPEDDSQIQQDSRSLTSINNNGRITVHNTIHSNVYPTKEYSQLQKQTDGLSKSVKAHLGHKSNYSSSREAKESVTSKKVKSKSSKRNHPFTKENCEENSRSQKGCFQNVAQKNSAEIEQVQKEEIKSKQMEASINEDKHMTVELGNWQQNLKEQTKSNDSEAEGVSAIFSFPKIPIISISIHTTPNNKTFFKISNRDNDTRGGDDVKTKRIQSSSQDNKEKTTNETETANQSKKINFSQMDNTDDAVNVNNHESELHVRSDCKSMNVSSPQTKSGASKTCSGTGGDQRVMFYSDEEDDVDVETKEENEEVEVETEGFENEKFSQDSNSACSLPLKKRPTQAEPNVHTEDSQTIANVGCEQFHDIAAEVVIENTNPNKALLDHNTSLQFEQYMKQRGNEKVMSELEMNKHCMQKFFDSYETLPSPNDIDDNKPSTSSACYKKVIDTYSPFKKIAHSPMRPIGQTPIQVVAPQLKDSTQSSDVQVSRKGTQSIPSLPESYPATLMLSVANVEKLIDFNRFIEDLLAAPDVVTIIDNANACGYYAEGQTYEMERIAILEHYNIANAKGNSSVTKALYWKKNAADTIFIFNDNDNEWMSLPPSTVKQLQKLSFVLSILQQQYKISDVRQRINIALTFLTRNTSKFKKSLKTTGYFNNQQQLDIALQQEPVVNSNHHWNSAMQFGSSGSTQVLEQTNSLSSPQRLSSINIIQCEQRQQQSQTPDKRSNSWDESNTDQLYFNPPCASSPQSEVIVNTNGVELHEIPQDPQNIFISITDESGPPNGNTELSLHKYNTRQQQFRTLGDVEESSKSASYTNKRSCFGNNGPSLISHTCMRNNIVHNFCNQDFYLQNSFRMQQPHMANQKLHVNTNSNFSQRMLSQQNAPINIYNKNVRSSPSSHVVQYKQKSQQRLPVRFSSPFQSQAPINTHQTQTKVNESNYKEILQPYITYLIKDHEKTSKHLLQVFEEVSNSKATNRYQQQFENFLPAIIGNPQQNHMPGLQHITDSSSALPTLIRNPNENTLVNGDSGALQLVQSFLEQSETCFQTAHAERRARATGSDIRIHEKFSHRQA